MIVADAASASSPAVDFAGWSSDDDELLESFYRNLALEVVLAAGADLTLKDEDGDTPLDVAI